MFACCLAPYRIAFEKIGVESAFWATITLSTDFLFLVDILIIFNSAVYDYDFFIIEDRKQIASDYVTGWFFIDLLSIIPFDLILQMS